MRIGELFSGYGGLGMGVQAVLGGDIAWHSEIDPGPCKVLAHRYPDVPNLGDITAIDWASVEPVDVIIGGSPCQDVSAAGKRAGMRAGTRSGLWASMCDAIDIIRPGLVVWENVRGALSAHADSAVEPCPICVGDERDAHLRALGRVVGDLSELGYVGRWTGLRAADVGAPHGRFRVFVVAWPAADASGGELQRRRVPADLGGAATGEQGEGDQRQRAGHAAGDRRAVATDPDRLGHERSRRARHGRTGSADGAVTAADAPGDGRHEGWPESARVLGGSDAAERRASTLADADRDGLEGLAAVHVEEPSSGRRHVDGLGVEAGRVDWGQYAAAVHRWERVLGRVAPPPTERGKNGQPRLSPRFVEFLMGLPAGWVTDVPGVTRNEALKMLGNGVVPAQAAEALRRLLDVQEAAA